MKLVFLMLLAFVMLLGCACGQGSETGVTDTDETQLLTEPEPVAETEPETEPETEAETEPARPFVKPEISEELKKEYCGYINQAWREKIDEIKATQGNDFTFLVQTDPHFWVGGDKKTADNAKGMSHYVELDFVACLGDLIRGYAYEEDKPANTAKCLEELTRRYTENANCPVLMTFGNHDTNASWCREFGTADMQLNQYDHYFTVIEKLKALNGSDMVVEELCNYYYMDFPDFGIRVVMLNTTDGDYMGKYDSTSVISTRQSEWFRDKALDTDLSVIVMSHIPLISAFPDADRKAAKGSQAILDAVESFVASGGDFIAYMYGHVHGSQADTVDQNGRLHMIFRNGGTNGEVVFIDTDERTIRTVGLSKAEARSFTYGK